MCALARLGFVAQIELLEGSARSPREEWNALVGDESPFLEWDWLATLEQAGTLGGGTGWQPRPLVVREAGRLVAACPLYVKQHSEGEFVFDGAWAEAASRAGIAYYPKLLVGVPFTPVTGGRCLVAPGRDRAHGVRALAGALRELCLANEFSGVHVNFCREDEIAPLASGRLPAPGRRSSITGRTPATGASRTISARSAASGATRSAASGERSPSRASRSRCWWATRSATS